MRFKGTHMQTAHPAYKDSWVDNGVKSDPMDPPPAPTYAQSKQIEKAPRPSFPAAPPANMLFRPLYQLKQRLRTKDSGEPCALLVRKAENTDASERTGRPTVRNFVAEQTKKQTGQYIPNWALVKLWCAGTVSKDLTGNHSQTKITMKTTQKNFNLFFCRTASRPRCNASNSWTVGMSWGYTANVGYTRKLRTTPEDQMYFNYNSQGSEMRLTHLPFHSQSIETRLT